jgi:hypothetical protein
MILTRLGILMQSNQNSTYSISISCDGTISSLACSLLTLCTAYTNTPLPTFGTIFYSDATLTTPYNFSGYTNIFIKFQQFDSGVYYSCRIDPATSSVNNTPVAC